MATELRSTTTNEQKKQHKPEDKRHRSIFDVPSNFFNSSCLLQFPSSTIDNLPVTEVKTLAIEEEDSIDEDKQITKNSSMQKWSCSTCKTEFESLLDQRFHFKSDIHRFNIKLSIAGKDTVKEEDFDELTSDSLFKDNDISSISGSEDEDDKETGVNIDVNKESRESVKRKIFVHLHTGERVSVWRCLLLDESVNISFENDKFDDGVPCLTEREVIEKLKYLIHEPRDSTHLRVVLLARGGHFAACVFDGYSVVAHKTFHRYVIRAKAGKKQSSKDASGKVAHSGGASIRRYNELALKKEIQELFTAWKSYFDASSCIFVHAPSSNRQLLFDGEKPYFSCQRSSVRNVPLTVRRPTFKEARRIFNLLTQISYEPDEEVKPIIKEDPQSSPSILSGSHKEDPRDNLGSKENNESVKKLEKKLSISSESESQVAITSTPLHEAAKSGNVEKVLELLEEGSDPCIKDERGRTPYMLAPDKEVRNAFRRFMALNLDKWDWHAANVPSALTKEMEESQAAKQAEKDAKRKARAKELKKLRKAKEKKAQAEAAQSQNVAPTSENRRATPNPVLKGQSQSSGGPKLSKEEEMKRVQAADREKRAAAAERRMAAAAAVQTSISAVAAPSNSRPGTVTTDVNCSCCQTSLASIVPFHRYNYKYCSTTCMHVHREMLEDE
ncbi:hypothetical protein LguiA_019187 [Lonicera macranthoides]